MLVGKKSKGENGHAVSMGQKISADSMRIGGQRFFPHYFFCFLRQPFLGAGGSGD